MGRDQPVSSAFTAPVACIDALCLPATAGFRRASSMRVPGRRQRISPQDTHATCRSSLTFGNDPEPSRPIFPPDKGRSLLPFTFFPPPRGKTFFCTLPSLARGRGPLTSFPLKGRALCDAWQHLVGRCCDATLNCWEAEPHLLPGWSGPCSRRRDAPALERRHLVWSIVP
jgi:hypothetical protein